MKKRRFNGIKAVYDLGLFLVSSFFIIIKID